MAAHRGRTTDKNHNSEVVSASHVVLANQTELSFMGQDCTALPSSLGKMYGGFVTRLDISYNALRTLQELDRFMVLQEVVLDNNQLDDSVTFPANKNLNILSLNKNKFEDIELLLHKVKECYPNLTYLSLLGNPACPDQLSASDKDDDDYRRYRYYVIYNLRNLKFLDSRPVSPAERTEALRVGAYMKVVKPRVLEEPPATIPEDQPLTASKLSYTPLPTDSNQDGRHSGIYGVCKYRYSGRHSEGNRFIRNHDL